MMSNAAYDFFALSSAIFGKFGKTFLSVPTIVVLLFSEEVLGTILSAVKEVNRSVRILAFVCIISRGKYSKPRIVFLSPVPE